MSAYKSILLSFAATLVCGLAQPNAAAQAVPAASETQPVEASAILAEKLRVAQAKLAHMQQVADRFSGEAVALGYEDNAWRFELVNHLMRADQVTVANVEAAADLRAALQAAASPSPAVASAKSLGQAGTDLTYVPISPCRIVDTRNSGAGGNFAAREIRTYTYQGGAAQGGGTCTFTAGATPAALAVNVTAVSFGLGNNPNAFGFLSVYPEGGNPTLTAWLNYLGSDTKGNAGVASINQADGKFSVYAQNPTHVVIDLFGVFRAATDGTPNFISKWDGAGTLGTSSIYDDGTRVHIGPGTVRNNQVEIGGVGNNYSGNALVIGNGTQGMSFAQTAVSQWFTDTDFSLMPAFAGTGRLGIGTATPTHMVDVVGVNAQIQLTASQNGATATLSRYTNRLEISPSDAFQVSVGTIASTDLYVAANHDVGIGTGAPVNRLQIGSLGSTGYGGNDIAFGNGTQATGITQLADHVQWSSSTDIALMPRGDGHGRVGINTTTPAVPLEVDDFVPNSATNYPSLDGPNAKGYVYFTVQQAGSSFDNWDPNIDHCSNGCSAHVAILASNGNVMAQEMDVYSDVRIKDVVGVSDAGKDLAILNAIEVTDYTLKDKVAHGNRPFKKVIAQQVETVYPQVVNRHTDFVPNVYRVAALAATADGGTLLHFDAAHGIAASATRLRLIVEGETTWRKLVVLGLPSPQEVLVDANDLAGKRIFVYGEEVDDFRTVDYDGLTTLNISATQELARRLAQKDREIAALRAEVDAQKEALADLAELKAQFAQFKREAAAANP